VLCHLRHVLPLFALVIFQTGSCILAQAYLDPLIYAYLVDGMRGTCHYTHLLLVEVESCELSAWITLELLISASQLSRITGVSHYTRLVLFFKHLHIMLVHFFVLRTLSRSLSFSAPVSLSPDCGSLTPFQKEMRMHNTYMDKGL
jgi:hypothetical protein